MASASAFTAIFWALLALGLSLRGWFAFRVWRNGFLRRA
jgi:hypothetical protein